MIYRVTTQEIYKTLWEVEASSKDEAISRALDFESMHKIYLKSTHLNTNQDPNSVEVVRKEPSK